MSLLDSSIIRSLNMSAIHNANTIPELTLRKRLWRNGFRYRTNVHRLPGSPDIVLAKYHTVIFIHGCFWHGHKECKYYTVPKTNTEFWVAKVTRNQERDQEVWRELEAKGWSVIIVWGCLLKKAKLEDTIQSVIAEIRSNGERYNAALEQRRAAREAYRFEMKAKRELEDKIISEIKRR